MKHVLCYVWLGLMVLGFVAGQTEDADALKFVPDCPDEKLSVEDAAELLRRDLSGKVMPFLLDTVVDLDGPNATHGYTLAYNTDGPFNSTTRQLVSQARMLHSLSLLHNEAALTARERKALLEAADEGYDFLERYFYDSIFGGYVWMVDVNGTVVRAEKNAQGQFAVMQAYVEYSRAKKNVTFAERAQELYNNISRRLQNAEFGGYIEDFRANWTPIDRPRGQGPTNSYGLQTQSFLISFTEALTALFLELGFTNVEIALEQVLDDDSAKFFPDDPAESVVSFLQNGRQFSAGGATNFGTYLSYVIARINAEKALGRDPNWDVFARYVQFVVDEGLSMGGVMQDGVLVWWASECLITALATAIENGRGDEYEAELVDVLHFQRCYLIDPMHGLSIWSVDEDGEPRNTLILAPWKAGLHEVRAKTTFLRALSEN